MRCNSARSTELDSGEGKVVVSDLRATTWEEAAARASASIPRTTSTTAELRDGRRPRGAGRRRHRGQAEASPARRSSTDGTLVFPTEHIRRIIAAARAGKTVLEVPVYDGSETGEKIYNTLTVIGKPIAPRAQGRWTRRPASGPRGPAALAGDDQLFRPERAPKTVRRADPGLCDQVRALRERHFARAGARLWRLRHHGEMTTLEMKQVKACK